MKCPYCGSTECKKLTEIVKQGTSGTLSKTGGVGVSLDGSVGLGSASTKGMSVTDEALEATFEAKKDDGSWLGAIMILIALGLTYGVGVINHQVTGWKWGWWYVAVFFVFWCLLLATPLGKTAEKLEKSAEKEKADYLKTWKCRSCGHQWVES